MQTMPETPKQRRKALLAEFDQPLKGRLLRLYVAFRRGRVAEYADDDFVIGGVVRIMNRDSQYHLYLAEIVEVNGQAGELPVRVRIRDHGVYKEMNVEVWEVEVVDVS